MDTNEVDVDQVIDLIDNIDSGMTLRFTPDAIYLVQPARDVAEIEFRVYIAAISRGWLGLDEFGHMCITREGKEQL